MSEAKPRYRIKYTKPSKTEEGVPCRAYCEEKEADRAIVEVAGVAHRELTFGRMSHAPEYWDAELSTLIRMLEAAFDQGVNFQKVLIRDTFREVIGI